MSWNNDNVPKIIYDYDDSNMRKTMASIAAMLDKNDFGSAGSELLDETTRASAEVQNAINKTSNDMVKEVADLMRERQYRQPSYHPGVKTFDRKANNQHMVDGLKDHRDGNKHVIYTDTTNGGYNYSQAFEFGLLTRNYPAHHPFEDAANHLNGELEKNVDEALRKGFE